MQSQHEAASHGAETPWEKTKGVPAICELRSGIATRLGHEGWFPEGNRDELNFDFLDK